MKDRKLNVGVVGAGFIGQLAHIESFCRLKNCRVAALAELRPELRRRVAERYGVGRTYPTHRELLKDPEVDAVVVVTPRSLTVPVALDCLQAGKHVLTEKPMTGTFDDGKRLVEAARAGKRHYAVGYMKRYDQGVQKAKSLLGELLASKELGLPLFARAHCFIGKGNSYANVGGHIVTDEKADFPAGDGWAMSPSWLPQARRREYEVYVNTFCHDINLLRDLFGRSPSVGYANFGPPAAQLAVLDFGTFRASLETGPSTSRDADELVEVYFEHGRLTLRMPPAMLRNVPATVEVVRAGDEQETFSSRCDWTWSFERQAAAFVDDILAGRESLSSGADSLEDLRLVEDLWRLEIRRASA